MERWGCAAPSLAETRRLAADAKGKHGDYCDNYRAEEVSLSQVCLQSLASDCYCLVEKDVGLDESQGAAVMRALLL